MAKIKSPCIRGLKRFEKTGCPETGWDKSLQEGCPCWAGMPVLDTNDATKTVIFEACIDILATHQRHAMLGLLEGNQQAIESFRNGLVEVDSKGASQPKPDRASVALHNLILEGLKHRQLSE